jgi:hypothetical protein
MITLDGAEPAPILACITCPKPLIAADKNMQVLKRYFMVIIL